MASTNGSNGTGNRLGLLCDQLTRHASTRDEIDRAGAAQKLSELGALVTAGPDTAVDERRVDELLDEIEDACAEYGLPPLGARDHKGVRLPPGFDASEQDPEVRAWACPWGRCGRVVLPHETATRPRCAVGDRPLRPFPPRA